MQIKKTLVQAAMAYEYIITQTEAETLVSKPVFGETKAEIIKLPKRHYDLVDPVEYEELVSHLAEADKWAQKVYSLTVSVIA